MVGNGYDVHENGSTMSTENGSVWLTTKPQCLEAYMIHSRYSLINRNRDKYMHGLSTGSLNSGSFWVPQKRPWCWERLKAGEGDNRGRDAWMASQTQWTWVWASSRRWWRTGKPSVLQSMGSQRVGHDQVTEQQLALFWPQVTSFTNGEKTSLL